MSKGKFLVSVIGGHECDRKNAELAEEVGRIVAEKGAVLVCGGREGIMEAACRGAKKAGGLTVGIVPGENKEDANEFVDVIITSGLGYSRNAMVAGTADLVVAFPGKYGTLSEIGFALNAKKEVYGFGTWDVPGVKKLESPEKFGKILQERL
ncbi:MAG: TIGR00725 family protein [Candidatus Omnitrophota bacterium]